MRSVYVNCFSDTCNKIRFKLCRTRENGVTYYRASIVPVELVERENGVVFERYTAYSGYKATLCSCKRASITARLALEAFITEATQALENDGFTPGLFDVYDIAQNIDCEVL